MTPTVLLFFGFVFFLNLYLTIQLQFTVEFGGGLRGKEYVYNARGLGSIPGLGLNTLQYSGLENPMGR